MLKIVIPAVCLCGVVIGGCKSIQSTLFTRDASNTYWEAAKLDGVPITVRVPTHVRIDILKKHYYQEIYETTQKEKPVAEYVSVPDPCGKAQIKCSDGTPVEIFMKNPKLNEKPAKTEVRNKVSERLLIVNNVPVEHYDFQTEYIYGEKIFTVDPKRPAAGSLKYGLVLSKDQYPQAFEGQLAEDTINQTSIALTRAFRLATGKTPDAISRTATAKVSTDLQERDRKDSTRRPDLAIQRHALDELGGANVRVQTGVIASSLFNLDDPDFELQVAEFLQHHIQSCCPQP